MPTCVPVRDMRDTVSFLKLVKGSARPIIVTKNGYDECVVMTSEEYEHLIRAEEQAQLYITLLEAEIEGTAREDINAHDAIAQLKARYSYA